MVVDELKRKEVLLSAGVPKIFIDIIDHPDDFIDLKYLISTPNSFYYYIPSIIDNYSILKEYDVVSIFENGNTYNIL
ncbi:MAG: hypothetical protein PQJ46_14735 [Spirochaetales bacterium]|nr:hypothetical protein [Spirochaetales bacterium]